ncbi:MAG: 4Fe-4S binding protein [Acidimicrobiia bacterium]|nr:4Fe-4S binding protein [Acidimicrobiia bacterium]NNC75656.1 4Fe-4S binding protein [Acidimicrobiia bacterium]
MAKNDVWFETPPMRDDYQLAPVSADYLKNAVKPKQFLHIDQAECILCEGCVDICPWKCIHYISVDAVAEATDVADPREGNEGLGMFIVDEDECTRCALCIDRCPTGVITLGKFEGSLAAQAQQIDIAPWEVDTGQRDHKNGYLYGVRW